MADNLYTCRLCTRQGEEMLPIFNPESLALKISWVSQLKLDRDDGLPGQICHQCNLRVDKAYQFKELCWTSDEELRRSADLPASDRPVYNHCDGVGEILRRTLQLDSRLYDPAVFDPSLKVKVEMREEDNVWSVDGMCGVETDQLPEVVETEIVETTPFEDDFAGLVATKSQSKPFHCEICEVTFKKKQAFVSHAKVHAMDRDYPTPEYVNGYSPDYGGRVTTFSCAICGAIVKSRNAFISHVRFHERKHSDVPNFTLKTEVSSYTCALCGSSLKMKQAFISHVKQFHDPKREAEDFANQMVEDNVLYSCAICDASFEKRSAFTQHFEAHATDLHGEAFDGYDRAESLRTSPATTFKCAICDAVYRSKPAFISHIRLHTVEKRYGCTGCEKRFTSQSDLTRHYRCHTGEKPFRCLVCDKSFARQDHLAKHGRTHTGYKPYTCGECEASFSEKKSLASHLRSHRGTKPYACGQPACHKMFARLDNYAAHVRAHNRAIRHACDRCEKTFVERRGLQRHMRARHAARR